MAEEPQVKKQHPVPQEVFSVQFKLVGDLTLRQFGFLIFFGVLAFIIFSINIFFPVKLVLSVISLLIGIGFAFVPIQDQPMDQWIGAFFRAIYTPTRRLWIKSAEPAEFLTVEIPKLAYAPEPGVAAEESKRRLKTFLATVKEEKLSSLDLEEQQSLESIRTLAREVMAPTLPAAPAPAPAVTVYPPEGKLEAPPAAPAPPEAAKPPEKPEAPPPPALPELRFIEVQKIQKRPSLASHINWGGENVYKVQRGEAASYFATRRNVRVGRRLTPLAISGQEVYAPAREKVLEPELPSAPTLPQVTAPPPTVASPPPAPPPPPPKPEAPPPVPPVKLPAPPEEVEILPEEAPKPTSKEEIPLVTPAAPEEPKEPEAPKPAEKALPPLAVKKLPKPAPKKETPKEAAEANIVSGLVHNGKGGVLEKTLAIIKDSKGNVVRAIKTNDLGRFQTTPLPNGSYSLELPKAPVPFATIKFELTGEKMEELNINPKK